MATPSGRSLNTRVMSFKPDAALKAELERVAAEQDRSVSSLIRTLLRDGLREYAQKKAA